MTSVTAALNFMAWQLLVKRSNGQATYRGNAAGKYVTRNLTADTAEIGLFTAKAKLEADFDMDIPGMRRRRPHRR